MNDTSPVPIVEQVSLTFYDAIREVANGKRITKLEWGNNLYYGLLKDGVLVLHKPDGIDYPWTISDGDILGTDWVVLE